VVRSKVFSRAVLFVLLISMAPKAQCGFWDWVKSFWTPERSQQTVALVQKAGEHKGKVLAAAALLVAGSAVAYRLATKTRREYKRLVEEQEETRFDLFLEKRKNLFNQDYKDLEKGVVDEKLKDLSDQKKWAYLKDLFAQRLLRFNLIFNGNRKKHINSFLNRYFQGNDFKKEYSYLKNRLKSRVWYEGLLKFDDQWQKEQPEKDKKKIEEAREESGQERERVIEKESEARKKMWELKFQKRQDLLKDKKKEARQSLVSGLNERISSQQEFDSYFSMQSKWIGEGYGALKSEFESPKQHWFDHIDLVDLILQLNFFANKNRKQQTKRILDLMFDDQTVKKKFKDGGFEARKFYEDLLKYHADYQQKRKKKTKKKKKGKKRGSDYQEQQFKTFWG